MKLSVIVTAMLLTIMAGAGCGGQSRAAPSRVRGSVVDAFRSAASATTAAKPRSRIPEVQVRLPAGGAWRSIASIGGQRAAWIARRSGVTLVRFDQRLVHAVLHPGTGEPRGRGWSRGARIGAREIHHVVAAFNGGFKLTYGSVGFEAYGRVGVPLAAGLGSVVTYRNGTTDIGAWRRGVPTAGLGIASVLQNQRLLVNRGVVAPTVRDCIIVCWGKTIEGRIATARSALGITGAGELVWAAGENLTPDALAHALLGAGVVRAVELDINPGWVAGFAYVHRSGGPSAVALVQDQLGIPNRLLGPYRRDFFTIVGD